MVVLIPAYEPDTRLIDLVRRLPHHRVVVVDDGSGLAYKQVFEGVRRLGADVVTLGRNHGKGQALKTGFAHVEEKFPGEPVVCADSDGQHRAEDIDAVARRLSETNAAMVLGARRFTGPVPARSRLGNTVTRAAFRLVTGTSVSDTQTGLRGYPPRMLTWLGDVRGERFEYEQRLLLRAARERLPLAEVEIATIYLDENASSHFRPVRDSLRVFGQLATFATSSLLGFAVDFVALFLLAACTGNIVLAAILARLLSATINYGVNRRYVFASTRRRSALRYAALATIVLGANVVLLDVLSAVTGSLLIAKLATELVLFSASYLIQRRLVF
ncbi:putative flippase GtrA [Hamadaea flava]|uniref:GtrA family protein n=1 Tax=Hamadaea flava TaxID=1742688 RepID=A0ABV8M028_9ACTN|nr:bifunctional glycosyltransferase family 2/GtrA family protein [Hamadaea flava]MCP2321955.1 putative flippase GtrA [Hamadaea flava]